METIAIHSQKIAQQIIEEGQPVITIEPNRYKRGKLVFFFERSPVVIEVLERNKRPHRD